MLVQRLRCMPVLLVIAQPMNLPTLVAWASNDGSDVFPLLESRRPPSTAILPVANSQRVMAMPILMPRDLYPDASASSCECQPYALSKLFTVPIRTSVRAEPL
jgi:hypothetical protein